VITTVAMPFVLTLASQIMTLQLATLKYCANVMTSGVRKRQFKLTFCSLKRIIHSNQLALLATIFID
jgi:hypothetical protein